MKKLIFISLTFLLLNTLSFGQSSDGIGLDQQAITIKPVSTDTESVDPAPLADVITAESLKKHLAIIASDEFEGRETGTEGNEKAANYIADQFKSFGLPAFNKGSYFQDVILNWTKWEQANIYIEGTRYKHLWDFVSFPNKNEEMIDFATDEVIFLGFGIDDPKYSDYKKADVKGKVILIYNGEPINKKGKSAITGTSTPSDWTNNPDKKLEIAKQKGVKAVLVIEEDIQRVLSESRRFLISPQLTLGELSDDEINTANSLSIKTSIAKAIMGKKYKKVLKARKKILKKG
ncbi:MAG: hypothetical protein ACI8VT_003437, partial [Saprospiraceae bacterium]